jgi:hypothetical protein
MKENLNFGKLYWKMFEDKRLIELSNDGIILYTKMLDKLNLSKSNYVDENGEPFIFFTQSEALEKCRIKQRTFLKLKKQLKQLGLIYYDEQKAKKAGVSTPIYVKHYEIWSKEFESAESIIKANDNDKEEISSNENPININHTQKQENCEPNTETVEEKISDPEGSNGFGVFNLNLPPIEIEPNELVIDEQIIEHDQMKSFEELKAEFERTLEKTKDIQVLIEEEEQDEEVFIVDIPEFKTNKKCKFLDELSNSLI